MPSFAGCTLQNRSLLVFGWNLNFRMNCLYFLPPNNLRDFKDFNYHMPFGFFLRNTKVILRINSNRERLRWGGENIFLSQAQPKVFFLAFLLGMQKFFHRCTRKKNVQTSLFKSKTFSIKYFFTFYPERNLCRKKITEFIYLTMDQIYKNISNIFFQLTICDW